MFLSLKGSVTSWTSDHIPVFVATEFSLQKRDSLEIESCEFHPLDALPADVAPSSLRRIAEYRAGAESAVFASW